MSSAGRHDEQRPLPLIAGVEPRVLLDGLAYVESPRWRDGRLWFCHWGTGEIVAVDLDGNSELMGAAPPKVKAAKPGHGPGWSINWLPDGRLLLTGKELLRTEPPPSGAASSISMRRSQPAPGRSS